MGSYPMRPIRHIHIYIARPHVQNLYISPMTHPPDWEEGRVRNKGYICILYTYVHQIKEEGSKTYSYTVCGTLLGEAEGQDTQLSRQFSLISGSVSSAFFSITGTILSESFFNYRNSSSALLLKLQEQFYQFFSLATRPVFHQNLLLKKQFYQNLS